ncbi:SusC/RagA family TonB-linked outer membrane protein [Flavihumibacter sp. ZG627]|uniref:SusC/RagA family TonB-linked outer membrane protein n=1 Tax=Flavihumibacter sp. ZG627 TaxID=1463156 RepID=UPI00057FCE9A|nr:SusC/RagA family TonB-linked outer membrane protein [Flavihumibacter sp. ZG627]KIC92417.1 hypothetical protein HY58_02465 [Flavihumibacter sp. ZG627]
MRKILSLLSLGMLCCALSFGQAKTVSGRVTDDKGNPVPYATVKLKGSKQGVSADQNGNYTISVKPGDILVISSTDIVPKEVTVGDAIVLNVQVQQNDAALSEVIVTALGLKREKKALGYAAQEVSGENLTFSNNVDVSSALAGKVAGVRLLGSPSSTFDNANIMIRGVQGLGLTTPLYVLDGTPVDQNAVSMDNVESITVLKGAAATALYGQRGAAGVVVLTSKKGKRNSGSTIDVKSSISFEKVSILPEYQNSYAGGYSSALSNPAQYGGYMDDQGWYKFLYDPSIHPAEWAGWDGQNILEYGADESWGPKIDGTTQYRPWYSWYPGENFGKTEVIRAQPNNVKDYFETGRNLTNSVAFNNSGASHTFRLSYLNQDRKLILPNTKRQLHQLGMNGIYDISSRVSISTDMQYTLDERTGQPFETYRNDGLNVTQNFNQWFQRQLDIKGMKNYREPDGRVNSWNIGDPNTTGDINAITTPQYWDNPFFIANEAYGTSRTHRLVGNVGLTVEILKGLKWYSYVRKSSYNSVNDFRRGTGGLELDAYSQSQDQNNEMNYETNLGYVKKFGNISFDGYIGGNIRKSKREWQSMSTNGGLSVPNWFNIRASKEKANYFNDLDQRMVRSVYGKASFGFKNFLFLDVTARNDWSSALPLDNNSYFYPSVTTSFVFSDLLQGDIKDWLTFGKLRLAYASVGSDIDYAQVNTDLVGGAPFAGTPIVTTGNIYRSGRVTPALAKSYEAGLELKLFRKLGVDFTVYQNDNTDQIINVDVSATSGFNQAQVNAGLIRAKGWDLTLTGDILSDRNKAWQVSFNLAQNKSEIVELAEGLNTYLYSTTWNDTRLEHRVGKQWGTLVGRKYRIDPKNGKVIIGTNGVPQYDINQEIGNVLPEFTGGFVNNFRYKAFDLSFSIDFQKGGMFYSTTRMFLEGTGLAAETVGVNDKGNDIRSFPSLGGGVRVDGSDGNGGDRTVYVPARRHYYTNLQRDANSFVYDASYVKLREVRLGYNLPSNITKKVMVKDANFSVFVSNAWLIYAETKDLGIDPSELESSWTEGGQLTATRQIGASLKLTF